MPLYNVLRNKSLCTITRTDDFLPDYLFNAGTRIHSYALPCWDDAVEITYQLEEQAVQYMEVVDFKQLFTVDREPGTAWKPHQGKFQLTKYDNPKDQRKVY